MSLQSFAAAKGSLVVSIGLVALRTRLFLTQAELAAKVGVSPRQVSRWETGQGQPHLRHAWRLMELEKKATNG